MPRVVKKPGDVFKIPLSQGHHGYAQWLTDGTVRVFRKSCTTDLSVDEVTSLPVAFRVLVFKDTPGRYGWVRVANSPVPPDFASPMRYAKRDVQSGELSVYFEGHEQPATIDELRGLETLAVWAHPHIVERLEADLNGSESAFLRTVAIVA